MQPEILKLLYDVEQACAKLLEYTRGKSFDDYDSDSLLRSGVERQFEIIGEAINNALKLDSEIVHSISNTKKIIAFRNFLIHGYSGVNSAIVWEILQRDLPVLNREVQELLAKAEKPF
jgi:uncharacterized protein with HEPN domain